jgi:ribosomal protein S12 methylthiotransferase accessory factor
LEIVILLDSYKELQRNDFKNIDNLKVYEKDDPDFMESNTSQIFLIFSAYYSKKDVPLENLIINRTNAIVLHVYIAFNQVIFGPCRIHPGDVCMDCFYNGIVNNRNNDILDHVEYSAPSPLDTFSLMILQEFISYIHSELKKGNNFLTGKVIRISLNVLTVDIHNVIQYEFCDCVKYLTEEEDAEPDLEIEEICDNNSLRLKSNIPVKDIKKDIYDSFNGLVSNIYKDMNSIFLPLVCVEFNSSRGTIVNGSYGRTNTYRGSEDSAILEMLERYSNMWPKKRIKRIRSSYNKLTEEAINPRDFILNNQAITKLTNDKYYIYTDDLEFDWVEGYSLVNKKRVLVPEQLVYFDIDEVKSDVNRFVFETSNGAALGGSLQEAILFGLFEIIERDSFLIAWYNKLELTRIKLDSIVDDKIKSIIKYINNVKYDIHLFDATMESNIPSIICLAINKDKEAIVSSYLAAGAHINPIKAIEGALVEVISSIPVYEKSFANKVEQARKLYSNPDLVQQMEDHVLLYSLPEAIQSYNFLLNSKREKTMEELYPQWKDFCQEYSITKILKHVLKQVTKYNKDVIVVNCSNNLIKKYDLYAVKVMVPGMLSMTFGQQNKRINEERVKRIPVICHYREKENETLNLYPHSFP